MSRRRRRGSARRSPSRRSSPRCTSCAAPFEFGWQRRAPDRAPTSLRRSCAGPRRRAGRNCASARSAALLVCTMSAPSRPASSASSRGRRVRSRPGSCRAIERQAGVDQPQVGRRFALLCRRRGSHDRQHRLDAKRPKRARKLKAVDPHAADRIGDQEQAQSALIALRSQARGRELKSALVGEPFGERARRPRASRAASAGRARCVQRSCPRRTSADRPAANPRTRAPPRAPVTARISSISSSRLIAFAGPPPRLNARPGNAIDIFERRDVGVHRITDVEDVADLPAVAVDGDRLAFERADQEMGDPALVLRSHLPLAVDAAHPEHERRHAEAARVIEHILVGRALRAAVGRVEIERSALVDSAPRRECFGS